VAGLEVDLLHAAQDANSMTLAPDLSALLPSASPSFSPAISPSISPAPVP
jgi:hypothetical protein